MVLGNEALIENGFLARNLLGLFNLKLQERNADEVSLDPAILQERDALLREFLTLPKTECRILKGAPILKQLSTDFWNKTVVALGNGQLADIRPFVARWDEIAWRIAGVRHMQRLGLGGLDRIIEEETFDSALREIVYLGKEQTRTLQRVRTEAAQKEIERIKELILLNGDKPVALRDLGNSHNIDPERVIQLARRFPEELVLLKIRSKSGRGRTSPCVGLASDYPDEEKAHLRNEQSTKSAKSTKCGTGNDIEDFEDAESPPSKSSKIKTEQDFVDNADFVDCSFRRRTFLKNEHAPDADSKDSPARCAKSHAEDCSSPADEYVEQFGHEDEDEHFGPFMNPTEHVRPLPIIRPTPIAETLHHLGGDGPIALDFETYGRTRLDEDAALSPEKGEIGVVSSKAEAGNPTLINHRLTAIDVGQFRRLIGDRELIMHNAHFESKWLKAKFGLQPARLFCTLTAARLLSNGTKQSNKLEAVLEREFGVRIPKALGQSDWGGMFLTEEQLQYAANDVRYLHALTARQIEQLRGAGFERVFELECALSPAVMSMVHAGFAVEAARLTGIRDCDSNTANAHKADLAKKFGRSVNGDWPV